MPVIMEYYEISKGKYNGVKHFELTGTKNGNSVLSNKVNISKDRQFSKSKAKYKCLTGLFPTSNGMVYFGDTERKKNLLVFIFSKSGERLTIYFYSNFYPNDIHEFIKRFFIDIIQKGSD